MGGEWPQDLKNVLELQALLQGPVQCPQAFVQSPVGLILALEFFQKKRRNCLTSQSCIFCLFHVPTPLNCTPPAPPNPPTVPLTTDCYYLFDHLPPRLKASWGRGLWLPHATLYPQYRAHVWQIEVMWETSVEWINGWVLPRLNRISHFCITKVAFSWPRYGGIWLIWSPCNPSVI